ncbi:hypothetical protein MBLNU230_g2589t1 [Neophaeotheca triangularis]
MNAIPPAPSINSPAPDFTATAIIDGHFKPISLSSYTVAKHWTLLCFFPSAWSSVCANEILAFSAKLDSFLYSRQCAVLFCSTDSEHTLQAWNNTPSNSNGLANGAHVPLISDPSHSIAKAYGILDATTGLARRALFIIDPDATIRALTLHDNDITRSVDETQRILDALNHKAETGETYLPQPATTTATNAPRSPLPTTPLPASGPPTPTTTDIKKSWSGWARPALQRAWSAQSSPTLSSHPGSQRFSRELQLHSAASNDSLGGAGSPVGLRSPRLFESGAVGCHSREGSRSRLEIMMDEAVGRLGVEGSRVVGEEEGLRV